MTDPLSLLPPGYTVDPIAALPPGYTIDPPPTAPRTGYLPPTPGPRSSLMDIMNTLMGGAKGLWGLGKETVTGLAGLPKLAEGPVTTPGLPGGLPPEITNIITNLTKGAGEGIGGYASRVGSRIMEPPGPDSFATPHGIVDPFKAASILPEGDKLEQALKEGSPEDIGRQLARSVFQGGSFFLSPGTNAPRRAATRAAREFLPGPRSKPPLGPAVPVGTSRRSPSVPQQAFDAAEAAVPAGIHTLDSGLADAAASVLASSGPGRKAFTRARVKALESIRNLGEKLGRTIIDTPVKEKWEIGRTVSAALNEGAEGILKGRASKVFNKVWKKDIDGTALGNIVPDLTGTPVAKFAKELETYLDTTLIPPTKLESLREIFSKISKGGKKKGPKLRPVSEMTDVEVFAGLSAEGTKELSALRGPRWGGAWADDTAKDARKILEKERIGGGGGYTIKGIADSKSALGKAFDEASGLSSAWRERAYTALDDTVQGLLEKHGDTAAKASYTRAKSMWAEAEKILDESALASIMKTKDYDKISKMVRGLDPDHFRTLTRLMEKKDVQHLKQRVLMDWFEEMQSNPSTPSMFTKEWFQTSPVTRKLPPGTKEFSSKKGRDIVDKLGEEYMQVFLEPSERANFMRLIKAVDKVGTAPGGTMMGLMINSVGVYNILDPLMVGGAFITANIFARAMAHPKFVPAMTRLVRTTKGSPRAILTASRAASRAGSTPGVLAAATQVGQILTDELRRQERQNAAPPTPPTLP